jgi:phosphohistidine phosphatase
MRLYLVQHGDSLPKEVDPERPLSAKGRDDLARLAAFIKGRVPAARILHSGKLRARQTAEALAGALAPGTPLEAMPGIDPLDPVEPVAARIGGWREDTLIAGHQPFLGRLVARLVTGAEESELAAFEPGTLVALERGEGGRFRILFMLRPEWLA